MDFIERLLTRALEAFMAMLGRLLLRAFDLLVELVKALLNAALPSMEPLLVLIIVLVGFRFLWRIVFPKGK